jgi:hypothetical protein
MRNEGLGPGIPKSWAACDIRVEWAHAIGAAAIGSRPDHDAREPESGARSSVSCIASPSRPAMRVNGLGSDRRLAPLGMIARQGWSAAP